MGWNDTRSLVAFYSFRVFFLIFALSFIGLSKEAKAQYSDDIPRYNISIRYPLSILHNYKYEESSEVLRTFSDSSQRKYERKVEYFFTHNNNHLRDDGIIVLDVSIDSLIYSFKEKDMEVYHHSQGDDYSALNFPDFKTVSVPLSKTFKLFISPYGEPIKIEGKRLSEFRNYIKQGAGSIDSLELFYWESGVSDERLLSVVFPNKISLPSSVIEKDSSWKSLITMQADYKAFYDSCDVKFLGFVEGNYKLTTEISKFIFNKNEQYFPLMSKLAKIDSIKGKQDYILNITPRGTIKYASAESNITVFGTHIRDFFYDIIRTKSTWELLGQYKF
ncbi:MAG: hypothetical protein GX121_06530 [Ignavibacteria bacterium]|jgi:hypothetical protein|nr:hypothetical protein [Ignavibacteria bacterium]